MATVKIRLIKLIFKHVVASLIDKVIISKFKSMNTEKSLKIQDFFLENRKKTAPENGKPKMEKENPTLTA